MRIYAGLCIGLMASYYFQSLAETASYTHAKSEIIHRRLGDKMQEKCKEEFVLRFSVGALIYSQKTSILQLQLPTGGRSQAVHFIRGASLSCVKQKDQSISQFLGLLIAPKIYKL